MKLFKFKFIENYFYIIKRFYEDITCWFRYNFNKKKWNLVKNSITDYPFDYCYIWNLEKCKLEEILYYFENNCHIENNNDIIKEIKLALVLLQIIIDDGYTLYSYESNMEIKDNDVIFVPNKYKCNIYVNTNNYYRFVNEKYKEFYEKYPHNLYVEKAKYLYYKLLNNKIRNWWD